METPVSAVIDGKAREWDSWYPTKLRCTVAIQKAKTSGVGLVTVRNSNHYGIAGYYSLMASNEGIDWNIHDQLTCGCGSDIWKTTPMMGTNPIAFSFPATLASIQL
jgi:L-2-hydroxycarboxylate dehydrogenase (NAD+)